MKVTIVMANPAWMDVGTGTSHEIDLEIGDDEKYVETDNSNGTITLKVVDNEDNISDQITLVTAHVAYYRVQDKSPVAA